MNLENNKLNSNEYYSLSELFATKNRKIIIPDFQRDYCWGDRTHGEKKNLDIVSEFLGTLIEEFDELTSNNSSHVLLGKIDAYESPKNHIYLTDGQQRLTTLYLIIGMLFRKEQDEILKKKLKRCLISDFEEEHDDHETYLQYSVRESTVFFLRDLVSEYFIKENSLKVSDIHKQPWYFNEYDLDPSIISMLSALVIIDEKINSKKAIEIAEFSEFVINNIKIQYNDVKDKKHGEERFVIINTTGKSLTVSENIKPILLGGIEDKVFAEQWEIRETWFWKNRNKEKEQIADDGINDFLTWCFQIIEKQEDIDIIKKAKALLKDPKIQLYLEKIQSHFEALKSLIVYLQEDKFQTQFKFINDNKEVKHLVDIRNLSKEKQKNILLPLLSYISKFKNKNDECYQFLRRLRKNYFDQNWKDRNENYVDQNWKDRNENYVDWRYVLQIIEKADYTNDCLFFSNKLDQIVNLTLPKSVWFNEEEKIKSELKNQGQSDKIEEWEDHRDFMGDLSPLFKIVENNYNIEILEKYFDTYKSIQIDDFSYTDDIYLKNIYRLFHYIRYGQFEHRNVSGQGYCMLVKSNVKLFLLKGFEEIWKIFCQGNELCDFFNERINAFFNDIIIKGRDLNHILEDTRLIGHYERVQLWSIIEFLYTEKELNFKHNICQFWEYPNLLKIDGESEKNNYSIGNLLLGTSYYNNKSGWIDFTKYPFMKLISENRENFSLEQINLRTLEIKNKLSDFTS